MKKTINAYQLLFSKSILFWFFFGGSIILLLLCAYYVEVIAENILDSILSIVSILFPLIAGFLTFGRDVLKTLGTNIKKIIEVDNKREGRPTPDKEKKKIKRLYTLSNGFKNIVISTFYISFLLIIIILIAKFNSYGFKTNLIQYDDQFKLVEYLSSNLLDYLFKLLFFSTLYVLFLNLFYLVYYIVEVNNEENFDKT